MSSLTCARQASRWAAALLAIVALIILGPRPTTAQAEPSVAPTLPAAGDLSWAPRVPALSNGNSDLQRKRYRWTTRKHWDSSALQVVWGACGLFTSTDKIVRIYPMPYGQANTLRCGPRFTSKPSSGYRHIKWRHMPDFEKLVAGTVQNWRDLADLSMAENSMWPTRRILQVNGRWCSSAQLYKINLRTGQVVKKKYFHLVTEANGDVKTAHPARKGC